jgi:hypothetical protein
MDLDLHRESVITPWNQLAKIVTLQIIGRVKRMVFYWPSQVLCPIRSLKLDRALALGGCGESLLRVPQSQ